MKIISKRERSNEIILDIEGNLDSSTYADLEAALLKLVNKKKDIIIDFKNVKYVSSAGLRVILAVQKELNKNKHNLIIENANSVVREVMDTTGFSSFIEIR